MPRQLPHSGIKQYDYAELYMVAVCNVLLSHAWADGDCPQQIFEALTKTGVRVSFDAAEISEFTSIYSTYPV